jgi:hypothetical protein
MLGTATLAAMLASCRSVQPYTPPTGGEVAKLLIRPVAEPGMNYGVYAYGDAHACRNAQRVVADTAGGKNTSTTLKAGPLATFAYVGFDRTRACTVVFSFYPKARHTYLLAAKQDTNVCAVRVLDTSDGDHPHLERSVVQRAMSRNGCEPLNKNARAGEAMSQEYGTQRGSGPRQENSLDDFKDLLPQ